MDEDAFNLEVRKFLKKVGITAQREIERGVREGLESGRLKGDERLQASVRLRLDEIGLDELIEGDIALEGK